MGHHCPVVGVGLVPTPLCLPPCAHPFTTTLKNHYTQTFKKNFKYLIFNDFVTAKIICIIAQLNQ